MPPPPYRPLILSIATHRYTVDVRICCPIIHFLCRRPLLLATNGHTHAYTRPYIEIQKWYIYTTLSRSRYARPLWPYSVKWTTTDQWHLSLTHTRSHTKRKTQFMHLMEFKLFSFHLTNIYVNRENYYSNKLHDSCQWIVMAILWKKREEKTHRNEKKGQQVNGMSQMKIQFEQKQRKKNGKMNEENWKWHRCHRRRRFSLSLLLLSVPIYCHLRNQGSVQN